MSPTSAAAKKIPVLMVREEWFPLCITLLGARKKVKTYIATTDKSGIVLRRSNGQEENLLTGT